MEFGNTINRQLIRFFGIELKSVNDFDYFCGQTNKKRNEIQKNIIKA